MKTRRFRRATTFFLATFFLATFFLATFFLARAALERREGDRLGRARHAQLLTRMEHQVQMVERRLRHALAAIQAIDVNMHSSAECATAEDMERWMDIVNPEVEAVLDTMRHALEVHQGIEPKTTVAEHDGA